MAYTHQYRKIFFANLYRLIDEKTSWGKEELKRIIMKTDNEALSALLYEKEIENPETTIRFEDLKNYTLGKGE